MGELPGKSRHEGPGYFWRYSGLCSISGRLVPPLGQRKKRGGLGISLHLPRSWKISVPKGAILRKAVSSSHTLVHESPSGADGCTCLFPAPCDLPPT